MSSATLPACRMMLVRSVFDALIASDHSAKQAGAIPLISSWNELEKLVKSVSSAYSTVASAGGSARRSDRRVLLRGIR